MKTDTKPNKNTAKNGNKSKPLLCDVDICLEMAKKYVHLDTVSMLYLDEFEEIVSWKKPNPNYNTIKNRFRKALNKCHELGHCDKGFIGTTIYQSGDSFGGKNCLSFDFTQFIVNIT